MGREPSRHIGIDRFPDRLIDKYGEAESLYVEVLGEDYPDIDIDE
jgi:hypothetical protein